MRQVYVMNVYSVFFLELYNKHKESYGWTWSLYISCIPQLKKKKKKCERREIQLFKSFLPLLKGRVFFFFFNLRKQTLKAELKQLIEAIQYASATLKFRENKKLDYTLINRQ